jgi:hypothetical protein
MDAFSVSHILYGEEPRVLSLPRSQGQPRTMVKLGRRLLHQEPLQVRPCPSAFSQVILIVPLGVKQGRRLKVIVNPHGGVVCQRLDPFHSCTDFAAGKSGGDI